jgi:hypothetical protein
MAKKKSLPTNLKEALSYHLFHNDIAQDAELKTLTWSTYFGQPS